MPGRHGPGDPNRGLRQRVNNLTDDERRLLRAAIKNLRVRLGSWRALSEAVGLSENTLRGIAKGADFGSVKVALKVARVARIPVDVLLAGRIVPADRCPTCGQPLTRNSRRP
jgi:DNA-binding XRE family transcriptional regulator